MSYSDQILYVDDDVDGSEMMETWLTDFRVTSATEGSHAKELIQRKRFDLHILDYCFPDMTAVELCTYIRAVSPRVPIIIYSAGCRSEDRSAALIAGATKYLTKPDDLERLIPEIKRCLLPRWGVSDGPRRRTARSIL